MRSHFRFMSGVLIGLCVLACSKNDQWPSSVRELAERLINKEQVQLSRSEELSMLRAIHVVIMEPGLRPSDEVAALVIWANGAVTSRRASLVSEDADNVAFAAFEPEWLGAMVALATSSDPKLSRLGHMDLWQLGIAKHAEDYIVQLLYCASAPDSECSGKCGRAVAMLMSRSSDCSPEVVTQLIKGLRLHLNVSVRQQMRSVPYGRTAQLAWLRAHASELGPAHSIDCLLAAME